MRFYSISSASFKGELYVSPVDTNLDANGIFRGDYSPTEPIVFKPAGRGRVRYDLVYAGFSLLLISENIFSILKGNNFSGWGTFPVKILEGDNEEIAGYYGLSITGRSGPVSDDKSRTLMKRNPNGDIYKVRKGLFFDVSSWDRSDIFTPSQSMYIFVREEVRNELARCTNVFIQDIEDIETLVN